MQNIKASFDEKGYLLIRNVISHETINAVSNFLHVSLDGIIKNLHQMKINMDNKNYPEQILDLVNSGLLSEDDVYLLKGHMPLTVRLNPILQNIAKEKYLQKILKTILGEDNIYMHMPPMVRYILPFNRIAGVPPHVDSSYNSHLDKFVVVWLPFVEIDEKCGGMTIYENYNGKTPYYHNNHKTTDWLSAVDISGLPEFVCAPMSPGDIIIFSESVAHASNGNISDRIRISMDLRFINNRHNSTKHLLNIMTGEILQPETI